MINIEKFIKTRKHLRISQVTLCAGICTQATLSKFEKHQQIPSFDIMIALCERIGLTLNDVFPIAVSSHQTRNENLLAQALKALFYQNVNQFKKNIEQVALDKILDKELSTYQIAKYFYMVILVKDDNQAKKLVSHIDIACFNQQYKLLFYAITSHYYYHCGQFTKAQQAFEDVWRHQKSNAVNDHTGCQEAIVYLLAEYQMLMKNYQLAMMLATYGIDLAHADDSTYFLENFFWQLVQASDMWHSQDFIVNEMIENARVIAKIHNNEDILKKLSQRKKGENKNDNTQG
ncbi:helix-turn-helix domain-containing protein [Leuconostoc falkenbergense]|uniref:helix-turn-helix domain-containing protein n=1 Tax=Leuconostoc falkenbergense TaxID=2766470 RepID=UPI0028AE2998|nr:helix-turn-helix transcriptional regulator [Leuconostoc falkenbergense]